MDKRLNQLNCALVIAALSCGLAQGSQILTNPGFESGSLTPWTNDHSFGTGIDWAVTNTNCHSGGFCAIATGNIGLQQTFSPITVSSITAISFWASRPSDAGTPIAVGFSYVGGGEDFFLTAPTVGTGWNFFDVFADLRPTGSLNGFEIFGLISGGTPKVTMADDVNIMAVTGVPEPATLGLLLVGLMTITLSRPNIRAVIAHVVRSI